MNESEGKAMMESMMAQFFGNMSADEKKEMCATMMNKMSEDLDMKEMMPKMMMGMMSKTMRGGSEQKMPQMPEMMLKMMMPHGIGVMLPAIDPDKRGEVAAKILSAIVEAGAAGMSDEQSRAFFKELDESLNRHRASGSRRTQAIVGSTAQTVSHRDRLRAFEKNSRDLSSAQPAVMKTFWRLHTAAVAAGALDTKTKELITLAISVAARCDDCVSHHLHDALEAGASKEEIADALGVAILMGGGTSVVYATHAIEALEQFTQPVDQAAVHALDTSSVNRAD